ncbi:DNA-binding protein [Streptomyces sp. IBSBF 2806]|uniref:DNA-binding protein n=1 Tax=Streptomyces sp. IBSBF 2806 TaxID=2903529 RepID=UPI002FDBE3EB
MDTVEDDAWMSQPDAARHLGVTLIRVGVLIANRRLIPAENPAGRAGVTTAGVLAEETWRANATKRAKLTRLLKDTINWF